MRWPNSQTIVSHSPEIEGIILKLKILLKIDKTWKRKHAYYLQMSKGCEVNDSN
jgi:hypothetical protein